MHSNGLYLYIYPEINFYEHRKLKSAVKERDIGVLCFGTFEAQGGVSVRIIDFAQGGSIDCG